MPSGTKQTAPIRKGRATRQDAEHVADSRFTSFQTDPRYRLPSKKHGKVRLDSRFSRMLHDEDFHRKAKVDRYGRPVEDDKGKQNLKRLYKAEDDASTGDEQREDAEVSDESGEEDEVVERELQRASRAQISRKHGHDPARQGGFSSSESDSDSTTSDAEDFDSEPIDEDIEEAEAFGTADHTSIPLGEVTKRLAVVNLDWDNVRAVDLMAVASSFKPAEGHIEGVTVYPSEFGRERMQREEVEGPPAEIFANNGAATRGEASDDGSSSDASEHTGSKAKLGPQQSDSAKDFDSTALRRYQLDRLRYYYAVIRCSTTTVAQALYDNMDGREYLSSANFFDVRFVPDDVSFSEDKPRDECDRVPDGYRPNDFVTDALQHSKVRLTWDEDDRERKDVQKRAFGRFGMDVEENDMLAYIASASSDDSEEEMEMDRAMSTRERFGVDVQVDEEDSAAQPSSKDDRARAMRAALGLAPDKASLKKRSAKSEQPAGNLRITFTAGLSADSSGPVFENEPDETTREKYIRKERERKARRKAKSKDAANSEVSQATEAAAGSAADGPSSLHDGFDDPFFEDPETANRDAVRKARKAEKQRQQQERSAGESASAKERAELELLMADEEAQGTRVRHFDMNDVAKLEKQRRKKKKKIGKGSREALDEPADGRAGNENAAFTLDVSDPRFAKVFDSHEYAIDPNDPRYKGTEGMKALLEEGRRRRGKKRDVNEAMGETQAAEARKKGKNGDQELSRLLQKVKGRAGKA